jgi:S-adenosylmethionine:tRNA-ribosyltransferase-isomerase (queuine synthetase)
VGTTVVRALETATVGDSNRENVKPEHAYTRLHIDANHRLCESQLYALLG